MIKMEQVKIIIDEQTETELCLNPIPDTELTSLIIGNGNNSIVIYMGAFTAEQLEKIANVIFDYSQEAAR